MVDTSIKDGIPSAPAQGTDEFPISRSGGKSTLTVENLADYTRAYTQRTYKAITAVYTITATDDLIDCTANTFIVTLPTAVGIDGRLYDVKNSGVGIITLEGDGTETIAKELNQVINPIESLTVVSDGTNWIVI